MDKFKHQIKNFKINDDQWDSNRFKGYIAENAPLSSRSHTSENNFTFNTSQTKSSRKSTIKKEGYEHFKEEFMKTANCTVCALNNPR